MNGDERSTLTITDVQDMPTGVKVTFSDCVTVYLGIEGKSACPRCAGDLCVHHRTALPEWERRREELAWANRGRWGARMYRSIGLDPSKYLGE